MKTRNVYRVHFRIVSYGSIEVVADDETRAEEIARCEQRLGPGKQFVADRVYKLGKTRNVAQGVD